eukprot:CAMPEP_0119480946 /NCGR_PEP_ID=MMETSP1344-20130328/9526_1 /TAXON_ID=236787 /ORGANISM="Florenciella parvula, Strain CCMP2471" /LENGTH=146 /DNA_ID=CAMNT_0007515303 /DNA_START=21 /DNA_END=456 /DNA_ORIENTATION=+
MENVNLETKANVYFGGKTVSYNFTTADGVRKSTGVVLGPDSELNFGTEAAERMDCVAGECEYKLKGTNAWVKCGEGESFSIDANSSFDIKVADQFHYVCHYGVRGAGDVQYVTSGSGADGPDSTPRAQSNERARMYLAFLVPTLVV